MTENKSLYNALQELYVDQIGDDSFEEVLAYGVAIALGYTQKDRAGSVELEFLQQTSADNIQIGVFLRGINQYLQNSLGKDAPQLVKG